MSVVWRSLARRRQAADQRGGRTGGRGQGAVMGYGVLGRNGPTHAPIHNGSGCNLCGVGAGVVKGGKVQVAPVPGPPGVTHGVRRAGMGAGVGRGEGMLVWWGGGGVCAGKRQGHVCRKMCVCVWQACVCVYGRVCALCVVAQVHGVCTKNR